ncbi:MAG: hypothetical protein ACXWJH_06395 [Hyphomicrobium sp.]
MIGEFLRYVTTFAPERVRKFGYLHKLIALEFRAKRCATAWAPHIRACRNFIVKASDLCERQNLVVVVGSGLLLEVPLKALSERFENVELVDIFHTPQVRAEARKYFNVKLLTGDVTGIFAAIKERRPPGPHVPAPPARIPHVKEADLVVSCNCLTQLAGPFNEYFEKERGFSELDADKLAYQVMEQHAKAIAEQTTGVGVLITDIERFAVQGDKTVSKTDLLKALRLPPSGPASIAHNEEWDWLIAPHPEEHPTHDYAHTVTGRIYQHGAVEEQPKPPPADLSLADKEELAADIGDPLADLNPERTVPQR